MTDLGDLKQLDPRTVWPNEPQNFTPWLADNLPKLGEALGLELEFQGRESPVGKLSVDLIAKDVGRNKIVVIENQLELSDHRHLGQLIAYAAGKEAGVVVWVCRELLEEHRQAIDWLNRGGLNAEFFGVRLELLQVDNSKPAVSFRCVSFPNNWFRQSRSGTSSELTPTQTAYCNFFQRLLDELREKHKFTNGRVAPPQNWYSFSTGVRGLSYGVSFAKEQKLQAELYIDIKDPDKNLEILKWLRSKADTLQKEFDDKLEWEDLEDRQGCRVACYRDGSIHDSQDKLEEYQAWFVDRLLRFKKVFGPILPKINSVKS